MITCRLCPNEIAAKLVQNTTTGLASQLLLELIYAALSAYGQRFAINQYDSTDCERHLLSNDSFLAQKSS